MLISFQLSMPNNSAWDGKWSGDGQPFFKILSLKKDQLGFMKGKPTQSFYYNFEDGWGANVKAEIIKAKESKKRRKASQGFCGYDWMVDEILEHGRILERQERIKARKEKKMVEIAPKMLEALNSIVKAQFDTNIPLASLNSRIANARDMLKIEGLLKSKK